MSRASKTARRFSQSPTLWVIFVAWLLVQSIDDLVHHYSEWNLGFVVAASILLFFALVEYVLRVVKDDWS